MKYFILVVSLFVSCSTAKVVGSDKVHPVIIVGGGASGISAGIQSARAGVETLIFEETTWLGGMITAAGVCAFDGNHKIAGGIFREFRDSLYQHYGGPSSVGTGWVSNTLFEPHIGNRIFQNISKNISQLHIHYESKVVSASLENGIWNLVILKDGKTSTYRAKILIDATELGDIAKMQSIPYDIGMDSGPATGEWFAPEMANDIVQDLTYVVILKDFGKGSNKTIAKPEGYDPNEFKCCCDTKDPSVAGPPLINCDKMLEYGKLPNGKYMINWPNCGNDIYMNIVDANEVERQRRFEEAKQYSLKFIYYLQHELGYSHLGIADDEYPSKDGLPLIPYHRESRRIKGKSRLLVNHIVSPFRTDEAYYRTGIAVGDYPIDHHHKKNIAAPDIDFINIKAPSYNIPLGSLIPESHDQIIIAEKSISVSNIVNGATRLQPVVLGIGQAAGALAAMSILKEKTPSSVSIRDVQSLLLQHKAYVMPYIDVDLNDKSFEAIQKVGSTGILKGYGVPYKWANQTWFYPEATVSEFEFLDGMRPMFQALSTRWDASGQPLSIEYLHDVLHTLDENIEIDKIIDVFKQAQPDIKWTEKSVIHRRELCVVLNTLIDLYAIPLDYKGHYFTSKP